MLKVIHIVWQRNSLGGSDDISVYRKSKNLFLGREDEVSGITHTINVVGTFDDLAIISPPKFATFRPKRCDVTAFLWFIFSDFPTTVGIEAGRWTNPRWEKGLAFS